ASNSPDDSMASRWRVTASQKRSRPSPSRPDIVSTGTFQSASGGRTSLSADSSSRAARLASRTWGPSTWWRSTRPTAPTFGVPDVGAVGLVDRHHVGQLQDALLDALELIAGPGQREEGEAVDHPGDGDLGLAHPHGLDEDHVEPRGLHEHDGLAGRLGDAAQRAGGRRRPDVGPGFARQGGHPGLVAEDRPPGARGGRVDREYRDLVPLLYQVEAEGLDEGRLAHP